MTKRDFELIARVLNSAADWLYVEHHKTLAIAFTAELVKTNPRFDSARFLKACGVNLKD